jgi:hypothetical protein
MVLTNLTIFNETRQPAESLLGYVFNGRMTTEAQNTHVEVAKPDGEGFEAWIATLLKLVAEQEKEVPVSRSTSGDGSPREVKAPLEKLAAGPYRSLGGYFDYSHWADRERFLELDRAIALGQEIRDPGVECDIEMV